MRQCQALGMSENKREEEEAEGPKRKWPSSLGPRNLLQDFVLGLHPLPHGCCSPSQQSLTAA